MRREGWSTTNHDDKKNKRILLVDDVQDVTYTIKMVLENNGFVVERSYFDVV
jgi:CheY-like chemotaxis protein